MGNLHHAGPHFFFWKNFSEEWAPGKKEGPLPGNGRKFLENFGAKTVPWICDPLLTGEGGGLPRGGPPPGGGGGEVPPGVGMGADGGGVAVGGKGVICVRV